MAKCVWKNKKNQDYDKAYYLEDFENDSGCCSIEYHKSLGKYSSKKVFNSSSVNYVL